MSPTNARRRQRSTRLVVAALLIVCAALVVLAAVVAQSLLGLSLAGPLAVVLGAAAARITHSELVQSRREAARDRAEQAQAYLALDERRTAEHRVHAETLSRRIADRQQLIGTLETELADVQRRLAVTQQKFNREARRADVAEDQLIVESKRAEDADQRAAEAIVVVAELEQELVDLKAELAAWEQLANQDLRKHA